tara:strand:- start:581 stop:793 length:213 start_codon:yes stop_codon:yes gene_type:complete
MELIESTDPRYFKETSNAPYDRHQYKVHLKDNEFVVFDDWMSAQGFWFEKVGTGRLITIEVLSSGGKGFS